MFENILYAGKNQHHGFKLPIGADTALPDHERKTGQEVFKYRKFLKLLEAHFEQAPGDEQPSHQTEGEISGSS